MSRPECCREYLETARGGRVDVTTHDSPLCEVHRPRELPAPLGERYVALKASHDRLSDSRARWRSWTVVLGGLAAALAVLAIVGWFG